MKACTVFLLALALTGTFADISAVQTTNPAPSSTSFESLAHSLLQTLLGENSDDKFAESQPWVLLGGLIAMLVADIVKLIVVIVRAAKSETASRGKTIATIVIEIFPLIWSIIPTIVMILNQVTFKTLITKNIATRLLTFIFIGIRMGWLLISALLYTLFVVKPDGIFVKKDAKGHARTFFGNLAGELLPRSDMYMLSSTNSISQVKERHRRAMEKEGGPMRYALEVMQNVCNWVAMFGTIIAMTFASLISAYTCVVPELTLAANVQRDVLCVTGERLAHGESCKLTCSSGTLAADAVQPTCVKGEFKAGSVTCTTTSM